MPTLGTHLQDDEAGAVEKAAASSPQKKVGPWIAEACRMRLAAEGRMPGTPEADARAKFDEALKRHGAAPVLAKIDELADAQLEGAAK